MSTEEGRDSRVWLVTGCSSGMGRGIVEELAADGCKMMATARDPRALEDLAEGHSDHVALHALDLLDERSVADAVKATLDTFGRIDVLLSAAGAGLIGSVEESSTSELSRLFETNVIGTHRVIRAVLPAMRAQKSGQIAAITSRGAFQGQAGCAAYCGSKAALNGILEGLEVEVAPLGIGVTIIEPGLVRSDFRARAIVRAQDRIDDYEPTCGPLRRAVDAPTPAEALDARLVAQAILEALNAPAPPLNLAIGLDTVETIRTKLANVAEEVDRWEELSLRPRPAVQQ